MSFYPKASSPAPVLRANAMSEERQPPDEEARDAVKRGKCWRVDCEERRADGGAVFCPAHISSCCEADECLAPKQSGYRFCLRHMPDSEAARDAEVTSLRSALKSAQERLAEFEEAEASRQDEVAALKREVGQRRMDEALAKLAEPPKFTDLVAAVQAEKRRAEAWKTVALDLAREEGER